MRLLVSCKLRETAHLNAVLILILLEVRLLGVLSYKQRLFFNVLILILLEVRLLVVPAQINPTQALTCLNPYSAGSETAGEQICRSRTRWIGLNPYSAGSETAGSAQLSAPHQ